jgi:hypothetical protein
MGTLHYGGGRGTFKKGTGSCEVENPTPYTIIVLLLNFLAKKLPKTWII